jgi:hypothetical protein
LAIKKSTENKAYFRQHLLATKNYSFLVACLFLKIRDLLCSTTFPWLPKIARPYFWQTGKGFIPLYLHLSLLATDPLCLSPQ